VIGQEGDVIATYVAHNQLIPAISHRREFSEIHGNAHSGPKGMKTQHPCFHGMRNKPDEHHYRQDDKENLEDQIPYWQKAEKGKSRCPQGQRSPGV
jgi:hypothetical protein